MKARIRLALSCLVLVTLALPRCKASDLSESETESETDAALEDEVDDVLLNMTFTEFKERIKRLIPYVTLYVSNNYVTTPVAQNYPLLPTPQPYSLVRYSTLSQSSNIPRREGNKYRTSSQSEEKKFIPSIQYDPRDIGGDNDYFTPVRYNTKINYEDYSILPYQIYQGQKQVYPAITTPANHAISRPENRYFTNVRPSRPYVATHVRDYVSRKQQPVKPIHGNVQEDYALEYVTNGKGIVGTTVTYPIKEFAGVRYIPAAPAQQVKVFASPARQPQIQRNPNVNLDHIAESFQLTERLPERLNKDNIDTSIKTLIEILNILHNTKKEEFPQPQPPRPPLLQPQPQPQPSLPPKLPQQLSGFDNFKLRPYTRPKVITETRFQATPSPFMTDDPERFQVSYKEETKLRVPVQIHYDMNRVNERIINPKLPYQQAVAINSLNNGKSSLSNLNNINNLKPEKPKHKPSQQASYNVNQLGNEKAIEYYTPYVQEISQKGAFVPTIRPEMEKPSTDHSYEITEDLSDDVLQQDERFPPSSTTEEPRHDYVKPNEIPTRVVVPPQTSLKYGVTRGKPNVDYPAYSVIPETGFSCKQQRYKGFFGDPATGCQVWHYCDLNGGKSSFLCPNGTIFSQLALTCDWWFNVKCETTKQLYVLNERLYKYILPLMPKFPEDFTGPEVDRYLEIKFKEMEAKLKEKKLKKLQEGKDKAKNKSQSMNKET